MFDLVLQLYWPKIHWPFYEISGCYRHNTLVTDIIYAQKCNSVDNYRHVWPKFWWTTGGLIWLVDVWFVLLLLHNHHQSANPCFKTARIRSHLQSDIIRSSLQSFDKLCLLNMETAPIHTHASTRSDKRKVIAVVGGGLVRITSSLWLDYISWSILSTVCIKTHSHSMINKY